MHYDYYVKGFTSIEDAPDPVRYSRMKFGCDKSAQEMGYEMAEGLFDKYSEMLLSNDVVVIPSPYNYVKNAATVVTEHMIDHLNHLLVMANGKHVEYSVIHRKVSYINDYGFLPKEKREALLANDKFFMNKKFLKGKLLLFVDDIKITGTHEEKIKEILQKENMQNDTIFVYSACYFGNSPEIEAQLNFSYINTVSDYVTMTKHSDVHLLVRPIKFLLKQNPKDFNSALMQLPINKTKKLYFSILGEGYTMIPDYQENILSLRKVIEGI